MLLPSIVVAFFVTLVFIIALRPLAKSVRLMDMPGGRKQHSGDVPVVGGIAMFLGLAIGASIIPGSYSLLIELVIAGGLLTAIGVLDDKYSLPASVRLVTQIIAVLIMVYGADVRMMNIGDPFGTGIIVLGPASLIITVLITVSVINAFNMSDGVDGLAGTLALIALMSVALLTGDQTTIGAIILVAIASIAAFLVFNFPTSYICKVRTFMGDAGSMLLGLIVVWVTMSVSQGTEAVTTPVVCLWFAAVPVYDLFTRLTVRMLAGHSPFRPDRKHFHHTLGRSGMSARSIVGVLSGLQAIYAIIGLAGYYFGVHDGVLFAAWAALGIAQQGIINKCADTYRRRRGASTADAIPATSS